MVQLRSIALPIVHNLQLRSPIAALIQGDSSLAQRRQTLAEIRQRLQDWGTLEFSTLDNGLFPAAAVNDETKYTGYDSVWVRDNIHVAHAHWVMGQAIAQTGDHSEEHVQAARQIGVAVKTVTTLMDYFQRHCDRFTAIIQSQVNADEPMNRPHIRFNGRDLSEIDQKWAHAQNDALGYFLWLYCKLAQVGAIRPERSAGEMLNCFVAYFDAIGYWADADSGHWEEARKIEASSIGAVLAGLEQLKILTDGTANIFSSANFASVFDLGQITRLIQEGHAALAQILPWECRQLECHPQECRQPESYQPESQMEPLHRRYDGALLFLIYPLQVVSPEMAQQILDDVTGNLQGDWGIKRYLGDSFWAPDYKAKAGEGDRTIDVSDDASWRDALLTPGREAQWCIFDPIISVIYGQRYQRSGAAEDLAKQLEYLARALGQVTAADCPIGAYQCPELYYVEAGEYGPNDSTPLLWTQANLAIALVTAEQSFAEASDRWGFEQT